MQSPIPLTMNPLRHLAIITMFMVVGFACTYVVPDLHEFRPWIPQREGIPILRLFKHWGEIPAFAGHGGSYRVGSGSEKETERLAAAVGDAVAANLEAERGVVPVPPSVLDRLEIELAEYADAPVRIEDPTGEGMRPFYEALEKTALGEADAVTRVAHYGDSSIATDLITSTLRRRLQERFGDAGHGFVLAAKAYLPYKHRGLRHKSNDEWSVREVVRRQDRLGRYGYGGVESIAKRGAWARIGTTNQGSIGRNASRFDIYYEERPRGGTFSVQLDGGDRMLVSTAAEEFGDGVYSLYVPDGPHRLDVRYAKGGPVHLYGVVVERTGPGIVYDSLGLVGARANRLLNFDKEHIAEQLRLRGADLIVLGFGGNEASDSKSEEAFYEDYVRVLQHVRQGREDLACLVFAPLDQAKRKWGRIRTMPSIPKIVSAQRRAAFEVGCAFYNTWQAMGGEDAMGRWYKARPRLAMGDFRHATPAGYEVVGNMFYKALLAGFADYLAERSAEAAAAASRDSGIPSRRAARSASPSR